PDCTRVGPGGPGSHAPPGDGVTRPAAPPTAEKLTPVGPDWWNGRGQMRSQHMRAQLLVSLALFVALPGVAAAQRIELDGRYWIPEVSARAKTEGGSLHGSEFDFVKDLGIDDEPLPDLRLSIFTGPNSKLRLGDTHAAFEGDTIIGRTLPRRGPAYATTA